MTVSADLKPFLVVNGTYVFTFTPDPHSGFTVNCLNVDGVNAEGDTFEEALECAVSMAKMMEQYHADKRTGKKRAVKPKTGRTPTSRAAGIKRTARGNKPASAKAITRTGKKKSPA